MNYAYSRAQSDRFVGPLLPFLAGVAVTSPFIFFAKNSQPQPIYPVYPPYYPTPYPYPMMPIYRPY